MAAERDTGVVSENEESEKPVREQLKKASISKASAGDANMVEDEAGGDTEPDTERSVENEDEGVSNASRGRLQKKRSFDDFEGDQPPPPPPPTRQHTRKRSRDSTTEEDDINNGQRKSGERSRDNTDSEAHKTSNGKPKAPADRPGTPEQIANNQGEAEVEAMTSPKTKRSRLHPSTEENGTLSADTAAATEPTSAVQVKSTESTAGEKSTSKVPSTSGFANTSAASPFASLSGSKSPSAEIPQEKPTSPFAASGFSSLAGSANSGFGAIGKTSGGFGSGGGFATSSTSTTLASTVEKEKEKSPRLSGSAFGRGLDQQSAFSATPSSGIAFGSTSSGFGKVGSGTASGGGGFGGFGTLGGGGGGLTSFSSGKPTLAPASSSKPAKVFGAPPDDDDKAEVAADTEDDAGFKSPLSQDSDKQDERFYEQDLETGEEDEMTDYSCRAKLYNFVAGAEGKKEWKERGLGVVRLNLKKPAPGEDDTQPKARLLMRAEGSHRVILNTAIKKEIKFGAPDGGPPQGGYLLFLGAVDGKTSLEMLQLKIRQQFAVELYDKIVELQEAM